MKPMLAEDAVEDKLNFPFYMQPKIDGVRGLNMLGPLTGRSLKKHKNKFVTATFSHSAYVGFDGELAAAHECDPALCRKTSSAVGTIEGTPFVLWWLFDYITPETKSLPYNLRYERLVARLRELSITNPECYARVRLVPTYLCENMEQLLTWEDEFLRNGYEGVIIRKIDGLHKEGRSTVREGGLLRIKRFIEAEAIVKTLVEGDANENEAQTNELGRSFRSSHQANKVPNGMIGSMLCELLADIKDPVTKQILFKKGEPITVSPGKLSHDERKHLFANPQLILEKVIKFKFFPKGVKDKPRFATYVSFRSAEDMS